MQNKPNKTVYFEEQLQKNFSLLNSNDLNTVPLWYTNDLNNTGKYISSHFNNNSAVYMQGNGR